MRKRLVTSALPYVNNIPHLGNLIQVLSADVFARFCRLKGYETMYVCGTDEYGTATETKAIEEGVTPRELCDHYHAIHTEIYEWFNIAFDKWGRTSTPEQTEIVQHIFKTLDDAGYIKEKTDTQLFCDSCDRFLADRYVLGTCPHCGYEEARGDQCENCGKLLDPADLETPRCSTCGNTPHEKQTDHLYIDLPGILPLLEEWMNETSVRGRWANNAIQMTKSWIRDGLHERCITRDLKWGIPVPKEGYEDKVFYVWFDAPIGYVSITATHTDKWKDWWMNPEEVDLFQFIGKDNIPFHTVIFPSSLLGSGENWTKLYHMSSSEYLNYENGKFSKSKGIGVFGTDARDTGIPADVWRFYIYYNRPEKADVQFTWKDSQEKVNSELIGNLGNLVNRTLTFLNKQFDGMVPAAPETSEFNDAVKAKIAEVTEHLEWADLRDGIRKTFELADMGNKAFQAGEPWKIIKEDKEAAGVLLHELVYLVRDLAILIAPYLPDTSDRIAEFLGNPDMGWNSLGRRDDLGKIEKPSLLFKKLEDDAINAFRDRFAGSQKERAEEDAKAADAKKGGVKADVAGDLSPEQMFRNTIDLRAARIVEVERHPEADKLFILQLDDGTEEGRQIVSSIVPYYSEEQLQDKTLIVVSNLKPAKFRGTKSFGMLLAAEGPVSGGEDETCEVIFVDGVAPGTRIYLDGDDPASLPECTKIKIDKFFAVPMKTVDGNVLVGETPIGAGDVKLKTTTVLNAEVG
ncbi:MAG: methionine--tRNA ligase [Spirochaetales bacterium]|uniref:Methionine--tRNA ligase n=1 Tax=Candidatus Thalassospirochaeta sargassi TaxID=3119039 RepID=A0AAJ1MK46_9SPIO|nr:methionine--tRNA ligase [Spirochaetales bacterium]